MDIVIRAPQVQGDGQRKNKLFELSRLLRDTRFSEKQFVITNARVPILTLETSDALGESQLPNYVTNYDSHYTYTFKAA